MNTASICQPIRSVITALCFALLTGITAADTPIRASAVALFKNKAVLIINGEQRILKAGRTSPEGVLLVRATSEAAVIQIAGDELVLHLDGKIVGDFQRGTPQKSVQLYPGANGHYFTAGLINGTSVRFLIDTGATSVAINKGMAKRIGLLYRVDGQPASVATASGVASAYRVTFDSVQIRALTLKNVEGIVMDSNFPTEALLGQSFLNRLNMRREGQMLELQER